MFEANQKNVVPLILQSRGNFGSTENPLFWMGLWTSVVSNQRVKYKILFGSG